jgi:deoxyinosine 3'endonuclease (endonuclease V)
VNVCLDVGYFAGGATAACVVFNDWRDSEASRSVTVHVDEVRDYVPGHFYQRELPCLLAVLEKLNNSPTTIIVDGHVRLDDTGRPGLGLHLYDKLDRTTPVIGVAKSSFRGLTDAVAILRGDSDRPLPEPQPSIANSSRTIGEILMLATFSR